MERRQAGFSLIEMVIAMVVTLIVSGAIYQLMTAGSTAFRREPEMADRQQNARVAMDLISRDILLAGGGVPGFLGVFAPGLNGAGPMGSGGANTDDITMARTTDCGAFQVCKWDSVARQAVTRAQLGVDGTCFPLNPARFPVLLGTDAAANSKFGIYWATRGVVGPQGTCQGLAIDRNGFIDVDAGSPIVAYPPSIVGPPDGLPAPGGFSPLYAMPAEVVSYQVRMDPAEPTVPLLQRSTDGGTTWVVVARGIEDLQIKYYVATPLPGGTWLDNPPVPVFGDVTTVARRVRVRISARALGAANVVGQTTSVVGNAIRGQLISEITPRAVQTSVGITQGEM